MNRLRRAPFWILPAAAGWILGACRPASEPGPAQQNDEQSAVAPEVSAVPGETRDERSELAQRFGAPAREQIAGIGGFRTKSRIEFPIEGAAIHELVAGFQFPARALVILALPGRPFGMGAHEYRLGPAVHLAPPAPNPSQRVEGADGETLIRRFELRRAAFLWPDGFDWKLDPAGDKRKSAPLLDSNGISLGSITADLNDQGRPGTLTTFDSSGLEGDRLEISAWAKTAGRWHPVQSELFVGGELAFVEQLEEVEYGSRYLDHQFVPVDVLDRAPGVLLTHQEPTWILFRDLAKDGARFDWEAGLEERSQVLGAVLEQARSSQAAAGRSTLEAKIGFSLTEAGRPHRLREVWIAPQDPRPPFELQPGYALLTSRSEGLEQVPQILARLQDSLPEDARPGEPYWILDAPEIGSAGAVVLPFEVLDPGN